MLQKNKYSASMMNLLSLMCNFNLSEYATFNNFRNVCFQFHVATCSPEFTSHVTKEFLLVMSSFCQKTWFIADLKTYLALICDVKFLIHDSETVLKEAENAILDGTESKYLACLLKIFDKSSFERNSVSSDEFQYVGEKCSLVTETILKSCSVNAVDLFFECVNLHEKYDRQLNVNVIDAALLAQVAKKKSPEVLPGNESSFEWNNNSE